jgi:hypothetical protein
MSHPNPYLFQISRMIMHVHSWMDITSRVRSYCFRTLDIKDIFLCMDECIVLLFIRTGLDVNIIHSGKNFMLYILMYPVLILTHVPDFLDTSGMGVTYLII